VYAKSRFDRNIALVSAHRHAEVVEKVPFQLQIASPPPGHRQQFSNPSLTLWKTDARWRKSNISDLSPTPTPTAAQQVVQCAIMAESNLKTRKDQYCDLCLSMTATFDGLRALLSEDGYAFYNRQDLSASAARGCLLCKWLMDSCSFRWPSWTNQEMTHLTVRFDYRESVIFDSCDNCGILEYLRENPISNVIISSSHHKGFLLEVYSSEGWNHSIYTCNYANLIAQMNKSLLLCGRQYTYMA
jgi:hypothetical protein